MALPRLTRCATALLLACTAAVAAPARAGAEALQQGEAELVHFAFASQLGSGVYSIGGRTVQIYRLPFSWRVAEPEDGRPGFRLRFPATLGLYDFDPQDVIESGLPDRLDTVSAAVGAEFDFPLGDWHLLPYAEVGRARAGDSDADATIWSAALHARRDLSRGEHLLRLNAGIVYANVELDGSGARADLVKLEAGVEARRLVGFDIAGLPAEGGAYLMAEYYADRPEEPVVRSAGGSRLPAQGEVGITLGTRPMLRLWKLPLPRVGLAYRFGDGVRVYRLVFGTPF